MSGRGHLEPAGGLTVFAENACEGTVFRFSEKSRPQRGVAPSQRCSLADELAAGADVYAAGLRCLHLAAHHVEDALVGIRMSNGCDILNISELSVVIDCIAVKIGYSI